MQEFQNGDFEKFMVKLKKCSLLIIDEVGYVPFSKTGAELLFQVFSNRYESGSVILTSNLNFSRWTDVFIDKTMTAACLIASLITQRLLLMIGEAYVLTRLLQKRKLQKRSRRFLSITNPH